MIPGCTTVLTIELDDETVNLEDASEIYVTLRQQEVSIQISGDHVEADGHTLTAYLTQAETLRLQNNAPAKVQANWLYTNLRGDVARAAIDPVEIEIGEQTLRRVLP